MTSFSCFAPLFELFVGTVLRILTRFQALGLDSGLPGADPNGLARAPEGGASRRICGLRLIEEDG